MHVFMRTKLKNILWWQWFSR